MERSQPKSKQKKEERIENKNKKEKYKVKMIEKQSNGKPRTKRNCETG